MRAPPPLSCARRLVGAPDDAAADDGQRRACPLHRQPPNGVLRDFEWKRAGSTVQRRVGIDDRDVGDGADREAARRRRRGCAPGWRSCAATSVPMGSCDLRAPGARPAAARSRGRRCRWRRGRTRRPSRRGGAARGRWRWRRCVPSRRPCAHRVDVALRAQRRVHLGVGVVAVDGVLGEREVVRRRLGGHREAARLGARAPARRAPAVLRCAMCRRPPVRSSERDVARDHRLLGGGRDALEAEAERRSAPSCITPSPASAAVLLVRDHRQAEHARVLERAAHQAAVHDRHAVVGDGDDAGARASRRSRPAARP